MSEEFVTVVDDRQPVYNIRHRAFYFSKDVLEFIGKTKFERIHFSIFDQLLRSATSIGANLVEGSAGVSEKDFLNFNAIALKTANETKYWLALLKETNLGVKTDLENLIKEADEISKIVATIIINIKNRS